MQKLDLSLSSGVSMVSNKVRIYADKQEKRNMVLCHEKSIELMEKEMGQLKQLNKCWAHDVACGDGRVTQHLLRKYFLTIDMFDQCPKAVRTA